MGRRIVATFFVMAGGSFAVACGGKSSPSAGSVDGVYFEPAGGLASFSVVAGTGGHSDVNIILVNQADSCALVQGEIASNTQPPNLESLDIYLESTPAPASGLPFGPGTYYVSGADGVSVPVVDGGNGGGVAGNASFEAVDGTCTPLLASSTDGYGWGSVQIDTISASEVTGSYDLTFTHGALKGSFDVLTCALGATAGTSTPTCGH
jgi:hypothetical protein